MHGPLSIIRKLGGFDLLPPFFSILKEFNAHSSIQMIMSEAAHSSVAIKLARVASSGYEVRRGATELELLTRRN